MKVCRKCGAPLREADRFCSRCGARVPVSREERQKARLEQKRRKEAGKVHFQTAPPERRRNLDSFEEYENRSKALMMTVKVLIIIAVCTAVAVLAYAWNQKKWIFRQTSGGEQEIVVMQSEEAEAGRVRSELQGDLNEAG